MTTMTPEDAIKAASSVARDVADGKLPPSQLEAQAVAELRELFGTVTGPDDPAWPLQVDVCRQVLALGGLTADELSEWSAVFRQQAGEPLPAAAPELAEPEPEADELAAPEADELEQVAPELAEQPEPTPPVDVQPAPIPPARRGEYDPLAHWPASRSLRG